MQPPPVLVGSFTKKEAGAHIAAGKHHLHSTSDGGEDGQSRATIEAVAHASVATYAWERTGVTSKLRESGTRHDFIREVLSNLSPPLKRDLREKLETIMEELLSNAIFHAYRNRKGEPRYRRRDSVCLPETDALQVRFESCAEGAFLAVKDAAGTLTHEHLEESFARCYARTGPEIRAKESGAGLGWYMIFETATHMKIVVEEGRATEVLVWIGNRSNHVPNEFSFNFFVRRKA